VSAVRFLSTHLKTLSASLAGGPPAAASLTNVVGTASGQGCCLFLEKSIGCTGPTSVHNIYIVVKYSDTYKK
jgi:hypothetical protein